MFSESKTKVGTLCIEKLFASSISYRNLLQQLVNIPIVALVEEDDKKLAKFGEVTGWRVIDQMNLNNGKVGYVYTRSL